MSFIKRFKKASSMSPSSGYVTELDPDDPPEPELDNLEVSTKYTFALFELKFIFKNTSFH